MCLWLAAPVAAMAQTTDFHQWSLLLATVRPAEDWRVHLEVQPRLGDEASTLDQLLARWAVGRVVTPRLSLWAGHAWVANPRGPGVTHEQRLWQQAIVRVPDAGAWTPTIRLRLEQRFVDQWDRTSHRARAMARVTRPVDDRGQWLLAAYDEVFVSLDDTAGGPARGFDRNRLFGGIRRVLSQQAAMEAGYLWQATRPRVGPRQDVHAAFVWLDLTF